MTHYKHTQNDLEWEEGVDIFIGFSQSLSSFRCQWYENYRTLTLLNFFIPTLSPLSFFLYLCFSGAKGREMPPEFALPPLFSKPFPFLFIQRSLISTLKGHTHSSLSLSVFWPLAGRQFREEWLFHSLPVMNALLSPYRVSTVFLDRYERNNILKVFVIFSAFPFYARFVLIL